MAPVAALSNMKTKVLLLSSYDTGSHQRWRHGLTRHFTEFRWTELVLPPRYFRWRIRGNPVSWSLENHQQLSRCYDLIIATSMVDIATIRGLYPELSRCPLLLYFHENQLSYPLSEHQHNSIDPAMVNIYGAMAADAVVFNSEFNRSSFFSGLSNLIKKLPDHVNQELVSAIKRKSRVICVPLEDELFTNTIQQFDKTSEQRQPLKARTRKHCQPNELHLLWNHRVEYDKGIDEFLELLRHLTKAGVGFKLILLGQRFRQLPASWRELCQSYRDQILINGYADSRRTYLEWVRQADIVISTATHEFQGLAVMEACVLGCLPLVPDRLSYPEFFAAEYLYKDIGAAVAWIIAQQRSKDAGKHSQLVPPCLSHISWTQQTSNYQKLFSKLLTEH